LTHLAAEKIPFNLGAKLRRISLLCVYNNNPSTMFSERIWDFVY
jgi:hypothetical protein